MILGDQTRLARFHRAAYGQGRTDRFEWNRCRLIEHRRTQAMDLSRWNRFGREGREIRIRVVRTGRRGRVERLLSTHGARSEECHCLHFRTVRIRTVPLIAA